MEYQITEADLEIAFNFSVNYFLNKSNTASRTTGQYRGLGAIANDFMLGKIIELGVASILETRNKKPLLDFEIHPLTEANRSDPDIIAVNENRTERSPNVFVEIKHFSEDDRWIGLTQEQFDTILGNSVVEQDLEKIYVIYAQLKSSNPDRNNDLLGAYLKCKLENNEFDDFCDISNLKVEINHVITGSELRENGIAFNEGSLMYETKLFSQVTNLTKRQILNYEEYQKFSLLQLDGNNLPIITATKNQREPTEFGTFTIEGDVRLIKKENEMSERLYIWCQEDSIIHNDVLGSFELEEDEVYNGTILTLGRSPTLKRNNIWIAVRNLENVLERTVEERIEEIKEHI